MKLGYSLKLYGLLTILFFCCQATVASWFYLGVASLATQSAKQKPETCGGVPGLVYRQIEMCKNNPDAILCVGEGVRRGIHECQSQFRYERWNCSTIQSDSVFGPVLSHATREAAFIHAVTAAGVVHAVTQSCSAGNLTDCSCDMKLHGQVTEDGWKWGGCSDNVDYGMWFARTFVDAVEKDSDIRSLVNLQNNQVGRKSISKQLHLRCRCHGVSGSCAVKSCWKTMPNFNEVGKFLKKRYEKPTEIAPRSKRRLRRREKLFRKVPIGQDELVYLDPSPNYCRQNPDKGIMGTRGRECVKDSNGPDSCDLLCCGRGYNTEVIRHVERCHCKFVWCCKVKCKICEIMIDKHTCK